MPAVERAQLHPLLKIGKLRPVAAVAKELTGSKPTRPTIWKWQRGMLGGCVLPCVFHDRQWMTTAVAFEDFVVRRSELMLQPKANSHLPTAAGMLDPSAAKKEIAQLAPPKKPAGRM